MAFQSVRVYLGAAYSTLTGVQTNLATPPGPRMARENCETLAFEVVNNRSLSTEEAELFRARNGSFTMTRDAFRSSNGAPIWDASRGFHGNTLVTGDERAEGPAINDFMTTMIARLLYVLDNRPESLRPSAPEAMLTLIRTRWNLEQAQANVVTRVRDRDPAMMADIEQERQRAQEDPLNGLYSDSDSEMADAPEVEGEEETGKGKKDPPSDDDEGDENGQKQDQEAQKNEEVKEEEEQEDEGEEEEAEGEDEEEDGDVDPRTEAQTPPSALSEEERKTWTAALQKRIRQVNHLAFRPKPFGP